MFTTEDAVLCIQVSIVNTPPPLIFYIAPKL